MIADVLTKALPCPQHERLTHMMGIMWCAEHFSEGECQDVVLHAPTSCVGHMQMDWCCYASDGAQQHQYDHLELRVADH
jgi:hypothetical protein